MAERSIFVRLKAEAGEFKRALGEGVKTLKDTEAAAKQTASAVDKARSDMASASKRAEAAEKALERAQKSTTKTTAQKEAADRRLKTALDAQKKANEQLAAAEAAHKKSLDAVAQAQKSAETSTGRLTQSLKANERGWQVVGGALAAAGAATTAVAVSAVKTGVAYNSLQQTSRAALRTMLGGAEAVNAQMAELDAFARTSPFSKQTFITAQQQMLAFGIESSKVIPYLSAINDATAAAGGSSQQLGELAFVMAQISAAGKITGQDLIQFGQRGVNAAELIGSQMGKTGAQIRKDITDGALDADDALDALAAGMSQTFEGASANVKDTFEGATDRVRAAWRDLASELSEPLVGADGGGALVDLANSAADMLRWFQRLPAPIQATVTGMAGLVAVGGTLGGTFLMLAPRIMENAAAVRELAKAHPRAVGAIKGAGWAAVAAVIVSSLDAWTESVRKARNGGEADLPALATSLTNFANSGKVAGEAARYFGEDFADLEDAFAQTSGWQSNLGRVNNNLGSWGHLLGPLKGMTASWAAEVKNGDEKLAAFDETLKQLVSAGDLETAAVLQADFAARAADAGWSVEQISAALPEYSVALEDAKNSTADAADATSDMSREAERLAAETKAAAEAAQAAEDAYAEWWRMVEGSASSFVDVQSAYQAVIDKTREWAEEQAAASESTEDSWEDFYNGTDVSAKAWIGSLEEQVEAQREWADNLVAAATKVREEMPPELQEAGQALVDELAAKGPEGADALAKFVEMGPKQRAKIVSLSKEAADLAGGEIQDALDVARNPVLGMDIDVANAQVDVDNFIRTQSGRKIYLDIHGRQAGVSGAPGSRIGRAGGGEVSGPGTATSDSIPALLSNGEHVLTAAEVNAMGGHGAVYRLRGLARAGVARFAKGGAVGSAERAVDRAADALGEAREDAKARRAAARDAQRAYQRIGSGRENEAARKAAKRDADRARKAQTAAEKALRDAERALQQARGRRARLKDERADLRTDVRRGSLMDQITGGRSGALSAVDRARDLADSGDLTKKQSAALNKAAKQAEKALEKQYAALDKINEKIAKQRDLVQEVGAMQARVASQIMGEVGLGQLGATQDSLGRQSGVTAGSVRAHIAKKLAQVRTFNSKLDALRKRGAPNMLLQEVLGAGVEGGTELANALLSASTSDWTAITRDWNALEQAAKRTGDIATLSEYGTTTAQAQALLDQYEASAAGIEKQIEKQAKKLIDALEKALSGGTKKAGGGWVYGPGTRTSDSVHLQASRDEFVVNAASAIANGPLLEAINSARGPVSATRGGNVVAPVIDLSSLAVEITMTTDRKFAAAIWRQGGQEVARTDRAVVRAITGAQ